MRFSTWDLFLISRCPLRWSLGWQREDPPVRRLAREVLLSPLLGRESRWSLKGVSRLWDQIYWPGREENEEALRQSNEELTLTWKILRDIILEEYTVYPPALLSTWIDSSTLIDSSADFVTLKDGELMAWVYTTLTTLEVRRSPLPAMESYLLRERIRAEAPVKRVGVVRYSIQPPTKFSRSTIQSPPKGGAIQSLLYPAGKRIFYPSYGEHCNDCKNCR